jgi:hypothetical protein
MLLYLSTKITRAVLLIENFFPAGGAGTCTWDWATHSSKLFGNPLLLFIIHERSLMVSWFRSTGAAWSAGAAAPG